jgi:hypothetical protein
LLESLPDNPADGWTATERDKFLATFKVVIDFCYPVVTKKASSGDQDATAA